MELRKKRFDTWERLEQFVLDNPKILEQDVLLGIYPLFGGSPIVGQVQGYEIIYII